MWAYCHRIDAPQIPERLLGGAPSLVAALQPSPVRSGADEPSTPVGVARLYLGTQVVLELNKPVSHSCLYGGVLYPQLVRDLEIGEAAVEGETD